MTHPWILALSLLLGAILAPALRSSPVLPGGGEARVIAGSRQTAQDPQFAVFPGGDFVGAGLA